MYHGGLSRCTEKNEYSAVFGWNVCIHLLSPSGVMRHSNSVFLLTFCLDDLFIDVSGVFKSSRITVLQWISPFNYVNICFIYIGAPMLGA